MTKKEIIQLIKDTKDSYFNELNLAKKELSKRLDDLTSHQIVCELNYIRDMVSRAYALMLLLEEIEEN